jgi:hypothetical protein
MVDRERVSAFRVDHPVQKSGHPRYIGFLLVESPGSTFEQGSRRVLCPPADHCEVYPTELIKSHIKLTTCDYELRMPVTCHRCSSSVFTSIRTCFSEEASVQVSWRWIRSVTWSGPSHFESPHRY